MKLSLYSTLPNVFLWKWKVTCICLTELVSAFPSFQSGQVYWNHFSGLFTEKRIMKFIELVLLLASLQLYWLGCLYIQAYVFSSPAGCAAFLSNYHLNSSARVTFNNRHYDLPPWSISILPDCKNVAFNTAKVSTADNTHYLRWNPAMQDKVSSVFFYRKYISINSLCCTSSIHIVYSQKFPLSLILCFWTKLFVCIIIMSKCCRSFGRLELRHRKHKCCPRMWIWIRGKHSAKTFPRVILIQRSQLWVSWSS